MRRFGDVSLKTVAAWLAAFMVIGGFALALTNPNGGNVPSLGPAAGGIYNVNGSFAYSAQSSSNVFGALGGLGSSVTTVTTATTTGARAPPTVVVAQSSTGPSPNQQQGGEGTGSTGGARFVEFFSNLTMESPSPTTLASKIVGLAYSVGGYVAYQSAHRDTAYVVVRVPASSYEQVLTQIQGMGNVTILTSTSNDVTVQYTNLNATLLSLVAEQQALLRLINASTSVNSTLAIEARLQSVNAQVNFVQSEILQTQRLVTYSTVTVSISKGSAPTALSMTLSATPRNGVSPVGVTFNAVVTGGHGPYVVNYNFGDGTSQQGQVVIHQFYGAGDYNVTVTATDSTGSVALASALIHVKAPPSSIGFGDFPTSLANLFIRVVEGIAEVAVVVLPAALVLAAVVVPLRRRLRPQQEVRKD